MPLAIVEPLKLVAIFFASDGHLITGAFVVICAYAVSLVVTDRPFAIVKPKLPKLPWFAAVWRPFVRLRSRVLRWLGGLFRAPRTGR